MSPFSIDKALRILSCCIFKVCSFWVNACSSLPFCLTVRGSFFLGYDFNIFLSSTYKQSGRIDINPSFQDNKNLKEEVEGFSRLLGSIVVGGGYEFLSSIKV